MLLGGTHMKSSRIDCSCCGPVLTAACFSQLHMKQIDRSDIYMSCTSELTSDLWKVHSLNWIGGGVIDDL